jgi:hypothetical protein
MVTPRRSLTAVRRWALWFHDQTLGETTLIAAGISNGSAAEYLSMIGRRSMRSLLRDRQRIVLCCDGLDRFLVVETDNAGHEQDESYRRGIRAAEPPG